MHGGIVIDGISTTFGPWQSGPGSFATYNKAVTSVSQLRKQILVELGKLDPALVDTVADLPGKVGAA